MGAIDLPTQVLPTMTRTLGFPICALLIAVSSTLDASVCFAGDTWTMPFAGVSYLQRKTDQPKVIHVAIVDLDRPELSIRAARAEEKGLTPSQFADLVGGAVVVNGDFFDSSYQPEGLAVGLGAHWTGSKDSVPGSFVACDNQKNCELDLSNSTVPPQSSWSSVVSGRQILVAAGKPRDKSADSKCGSFCTTPHPRTALGLTADRRKLFLIVVEGRRGKQVGMALAELAALFVELGAFEAINLDGGGSSGMVIAGKLVNQRPFNEPSERRVANHLAILYQDQGTAPAPDAAVDSSQSSEAVPPPQDMLRSSSDAAVLTAREPAQPQVSPSGCNLAGSAPPCFLLVLFAIHWAIRFRVGR
jgi:hypothetical protein